MDQFASWLDERRGRQAELAAALKITSGAISQWSQVPPERALEVERITGISRHDLRPDIFGPSNLEKATS